VRDAGYLDPDPAARLPHAFPALSDAHVVVAQTLMDNDPNRGPHYRRALDVGLPSFGPWLDLLASESRRFGLVHSRVALIRRVFEGRLSAFPWTAWSPRLTIGRPIDAG
jgi:hypothetical protein